MSRIFVIFARNFTQRNTLMKKVLIAEDNDSNYMLMTYILRGKYDCVRAVNGQEAVEKAKEPDIKLILMDLKMPVMDGLEATAAIKKELPDMPIVALTANAFDSDREAAKEAGCDDFLAKPVNSALCLETIAKYIKE